MLVNCAKTSASSSLGPSLSIDLSFSTTQKFPLRSPLRSLRLSAKAPDGSTTWQYAAEGEKEVDAFIKQSTLPPENWYTGPGQYSLQVSYCFAGTAGEVKQEAQAFLVAGQELRIAANLWFLEDQQKHQTLLADLTITRFLTGDQSVWLIQDWAPARRSMPRYQIVNSTNHPIYGVSWLGNFFGRIQRELSGHWINYPRGGFCGTVAGGESLEPNESAGSTEGYFIGGANPFVNGRYRYVVQYSLTPTSIGVPTELTDHGITRKRVQNIYEVSAEFYVESNLVR